MKIFELKYVLDGEGITRLFATNTKEEAWSELKQELAEKYNPETLKQLAIYQTTKL